MQPLNVKPPPPKATTSDLRATDKTAPSSAAQSSFSSNRSRKTLLYETFSSHIFFN